MGNIFEPFCFFSVPLLFIFGGIGISYLIYLSNEDKKSAWKHLAASNHLTFMAGSWLKGGAYVYGQYRGHSLRLTTFQKRQGKSSYTCTRITVTASQTTKGKPWQDKTPLAEPLTAREVTKLLTAKQLPGSLKGKLTIESYGYKLYYEQQGVEGDGEYLQHLFDLMTDLADSYIKVLGLGGETVLALHEIATDGYHVLKPIARQLLHDISRETSRRLGGRARQLVCPRCLTSCEEHEISFNWFQAVTYYGCRICGQSRQFLKGDWLVAILDSDLALEKFQQNGILHVNWLERRRLFDFDEVQIIQATDEDVERFAVQVGNDTDPVRKPRYPKMHCVVAPECKLSQNTMRILARMFGSVAFKDNASTSSIGHYFQ
jgi:hypothetical protein